MRVEFLMPMIVMIGMFLFAVVIMPVIIMLILGVVVMIIMPVIVMLVLGVVVMIIMPMIVMLVLGVVVMIVMPMIVMLLFAVIIMIFMVIMIIMSVRVERTSFTEIQFGQAVTFRKEYGRRLCRDPFNGLFQKCFQIMAHPENKVGFLKLFGLRWFQRIGMW